MRSYYVLGTHVGLSVEEPTDRRLRYENWLDREQQRAFNHQPQWQSHEDFCAFFDAPGRPKSRFEATVVRLSDQQPIGTVTLAPANRDPDLSITLWRDYRGHGYGSEAFRLASDYVLAAFDLPYIIAASREDNVASIKMLEKCDFRRDPEKDELLEDAFVQGMVRWLAFRRDRVSCALSG